MSDVAGRETVSAVELANAFFDAFNREGIESALRYAVPDGTWHAAPGWAGKPVYRGGAGARELAGEWTEQFDHYRWMPDRSIELSERRALLLAHHSGRTRAGVPIEGKVAGLFEVEGGRIKEIWFFFSWEEALEAAEVSE
ncbi:MAG: nuclear transport factor 2 family protein [Solirubrobacterales bacterium]